MVKGNLEVISLSTVLFGTVEYYERELIYYLTDAAMNNLTRGDAAKKVFKMLEAELFNVLLCTDESVRIQCMHNLLKAFGTVSDKAMAASAR